MAKQTGLIVLLIALMFTMPHNFIFAGYQHDLEVENEALKQELRRMADLLKKNGIDSASDSKRDGGNVLEPWEKDEKTVLEDVEVVVPVAEKPIKDHPGTVNVITKEEIERRHPSSTDEVLKKIPGLNVIDEYGRGLRPNFGFRGLAPLRSTNTLLLIDDIPFQPAVYGDPGAYYNVPVQRLEEIEVIKGGASVKYGPNTMGGVVNYKTKELVEDPKLVLKSTFGSHDLMENELSYYGKAGKLKYMVDYFRREGEGFRDNMRFDVNDFTFKIGSPLDQESDLTFNFNYYDEDAETSGGLTEAQFEDQISQTQRPFDFFEGQRFSVDLTYRRQLTENSSINTKLFGNFFERNWFAADGQGRDIETNRGFLRKFNVFGVEPIYTLQYNLGPIKNVLTVGSRLVLERETDVRTAGTTPDDRSGKTTRDADLETVAVASYVENEFKITDKLSIIPGFRHERVDLDRDLRLAPTSEVGTNDGSLTQEFLPAIGITYKLKDETTFFASARRNFQPPRFSEAVDAQTGTSNDLDAEIGKNFEVGVRSRPLEWLYGELTFFRLDFDNQIVAEDGALVNGGTTRSEGIEGSIDIDWFDMIGSLLKRPLPESYGSLSTNFNFTILDTRFENGEFSGNTLPQAPDHKLGWEVAYSHPTGFSASIDGLWVDSQFSDSANTNTPTPDGNTGQIPQYRVWNLNLAYDNERWQRFSVFGGIKNLFDEEYFTRRQAFFGGIIPSQDRTFYTGFQWQL